MDTIRVLVTGAGSGVGQGVIKSLRKSTLPLEVFVADIDRYQSALYRADKAILIPKVEDENAYDKIIEILTGHKIDVVMIGSEFDVGFFSEHKESIEKEAGVTVIVSASETVSIADDKWKTVEFLKNNQLPHAKSFLPNSLTHAQEIVTSKKIELPFILKTRTGTSNRHVHLIKTINDLNDKYESVPNPVIQELINEPSLENEYTCSVFKCRDGRLLGPFTSRRTLRNGTSWVIEVRREDKLKDLMLAIGEKLAICGSLNVQLLRRGDEFVPFEFNARFSGTTAVRAHFGFNEPEMAIRHYHLGEELNDVTIAEGLCFRYLEEIFLDGHSLNDLEEEMPRGTIEQWF